MKDLNGVSQSGGVRLAVPARVKAVAVDVKSETATGDSDAASADGSEMVAQSPNASESRHSSRVASSLSKASPILRLHSAGGWGLPGQRSAVAS
jgi:hypothetical protein